MDIQHLLAQAKGVEDAQTIYVVQTRSGGERDILRVRALRLDREATASSDHVDCKTERQLIIIVNRNGIVREIVYADGSSGSTAPFSVIEGEFSYGREVSIMEATQILKDAEAACLAARGKDGCS